jgi:hypothetical protein
VEKQIEKHFDFIENLIQQLHKEPKENELVLYKVNELIELRNLLKQKDIDERFQSLAFKLYQQINKDNQSCLKAFNRKLEFNDCLNDEDINDYLSCLKKSKKNDEIMNHLDKKMGVSLSELKNNLLDQCVRVFAKIKSKNIDKEIDDIKNLIDNLLAMKNLSIQYSDESILNSINKSYDSAKEFIGEKINTKISLNNEMIKTSFDLDQIINELEKIRKISELFKNHDEKFLGYYIIQRDELNKNFLKLLEESDAIMKKEELNESDFKKLNQVNEYFNQAMSSKEIENHLSLDEIKSQHKKLLLYVLEFFKHIEAFSSKI